MKKRSGIKKLLQKMGTLPSSTERQHECHDLRQAQLKMFRQIDREREREGKSCETIFENVFQFSLTFSP